MFRRDLEDETYWLATTVYVKARPDIKPPTRCGTPDLPLLPNTKLTDLPLTLLAVVEILLPLPGSLRRSSSNGFHNVDSSKPVCLCCSYQRLIYYHCNQRHQPVVNTAVDTAP